MTTKIVNVVFVKAYEPCVYWQGFKNVEVIDQDRYNKEED